VKAIGYLLCLSVSVLCTPASFALVTAAPALSAGLGEVLQRLDKDQSHRMTHPGGTGETLFVSVSPDHVLEELGRSGTTAMVVLGTRGRGENAPVSIKRVLRISGSEKDVVDARFGSAYLLKHPDQTRLAEPLLQLASEGRLDTPSGVIAVETLGAHETSRTLNAWKGVQYVATLQSGAGPRGLTLKSLFVVPDSIRISIDGDGNTVSDVPASNAASSPELMQKQLEQTRQEQLAHAQEVRQHVEQQMAEQARAMEETQEQERQRQQLEQEPQAGTVNQ
jgi:hypothetical protein